MGDGLCCGSKCYMLLFSKSALYGWLIAGVTIKNAKNVLLHIKLDEEQILGFSFRGTWGFFAILWRFALATIGRIIFQCSWSYSWPWSWHSLIRLNTSATTSSLHCNKAEIEIFVAAFLTLRLLSLTTPRRP